MKLENLTKEEMQIIILALNYVAEDNHSHNDINTDQVQNDYQERFKFHDSPERDEAEEAECTNLLRKLNQAYTKE